MEDLWDDINDLSSLPVRPGPRIPVAFQDFLSRPFAAAAAGATPPPPPPAPSVDREVTSPEFHFLGGAAAADPLLRPSYSASSGCSFDGLTPSPAFPGGRRRRRVPDSPDRRHKRMMKNREAAARSRDRKEALLTGLEEEVANLMQENARLNKQCQKLRQAVEAKKSCNRLILQRTSSAPF